MNNYKCDKCGFQDEYSTAKSVPKSMNPPELCPECKDGKMEMQWTNMGNVSHDVKGGYEYEYGKKARYHNDPVFKSKVISDPNVNPY